MCHCMIHRVTWWKAWSYGLWLTFSLDKDWEVHIMVSWPNPFLGGYRDRPVSDRGRYWVKELIAGSSSWLRHVSNFPAVPPNPFVLFGGAQERWRSRFGAPGFMDIAGFCTTVGSDRRQWFMGMISYSDIRVWPRCLTEPGFPRDQALVESERKGDDSDKTRSLSYSVVPVPFPMPCPPSWQ